jgi:hypothetical protein
LLGLNTAGSASASASGTVTVTQPTVSSLCPSRLNPTACVWCNTNGSTQAACNTNANGQNGTDDAVNTAQDATGDDCRWYTPENICLNDQG